MKHAISGVHALIPLVLEIALADGIQSLEFLITSDGAWFLPFDVADGDEGVGLFSILDHGFELAVDFAGLLAFFFLPLDLGDAFIDGFESRVDFGIAFLLEVFDHFKGAIVVAFFSDGHDFGSFLADVAVE